MNKDDKQILASLQKLYKQDKRFFAFLGDFLISRGEEKKGIRIIKDNINDHKGYISGEMVLGQIYYDNNNYEMAEMLFRGALSKNENSVKALKYLAGIESSRNNREKQLELLKEVLKHDPFDQDAKNVLRMNKITDVVPDDEKFEKAVESSVNEINTENEEAQEEVQEQGVDKFDSSGDIDVPDIPVDDGDKILKKHKFGKDVLDKEKSFSEDITESLENLTQSYIDENRKTTTSVADDRNDYSDILKPKETHYKPSKEHDAKIDEIIQSLELSLDEYKDKMDAASKLLDEDPDDYDNQVAFAHARFSFAASSIKKEIAYYTEMVKEQPGNEKYNKKLISYKDELMRLNKELIEEMNVLKNEYY